MMKALKECRPFLVEADHYPHIVQYGQYAFMNVGLTPKLLDHYLRVDQGMLQLLLSFLLISSAEIEGLISGADAISDLSVVCQLLLSIMTPPSVLIGSF